jgi:hypothetical protein
LILLAAEADVDILENPWLEVGVCERVRVRRK